MQSIHIVLSCALCRKIKDEHWDGAVGSEWCEMVTYLRRYQARASELFLSEAFCPDCTLSYNRLMTYGDTRQRDLF